MASEKELEIKRYIVKLKEVEDEYSEYRNNYLQMQEEC
jgi:hypothetical protein